MRQILLDATFEAGHDETLMASERKVSRAALSTPAIPQGRAPGLGRPLPRRMPVESAREGEQRFDLFDPHAPPPKQPSRAPLLWIPVVVAVLFAVAFTRTLIVRTLLPLALAAAAIVMLVQRSRGRKRALRERTLRRGLLLRPDELRFKPGAGELARTVLDLRRPFGATVLSTHRRDRLVLLLTSERGVFQIGTVVDARSMSVLAPVFDRATTVAGEDAAFEAIGSDGEPVLLSPEDFVALAGELSADDPGCLDRVIVTDTRGAPVVLGDGELRVDDLAFDLTAPLEWRALVFQEPFGQVMTLYQGTWIRQNGSEVVLVSLLPSLGPILEVEPGEIATLDRAVLRDLRLMQASAETPPPREQRHAIERLLMMPIRSSLDRAPRKSRQPAAPRRPPLH